MRKKIVILSIIFAVFFISKIPVAFAAVDCAKYKNTCPSEALISQIEKSCDRDILNSIYPACEREKQNAQNRIIQLSAQKTQIENKEGNIQWYLSNLNYDLRNINAEIVNANISISKIDSEIKRANKILAVKKAALSATIKEVYELNQTSYVEMLLSFGTLSKFSDKLIEIGAVQKEITGSLKDISQIKQKLAQKKQEQYKYKQVQNLSRQSLAAKQNQQEYLLSQLKSAKTPIEQEMATLTSELRELKASMSRIQDYLSMWLIGSKPTWAQIFSAVQNASSSYPQVRTSLLLGVLSSESGYGTGLGVAGKYKEYCQGNELDNLLKICGKYGYDPAKVPMSSACALGPAQFIPSTWLGYGDGGNPWNLNDALRGMAHYLTALGAATKEETALIRYNCGYKDWCSISSSVLDYANRVISAANKWDNIIEKCGGLNLECSKMRERIGDSGIPLR
jgi:peptidoglycan hydrolase CwlO-like protein